MNLYFEIPPGDEFLLQLIRGKCRALGLEEDVQWNRQFNSSDCIARFLILYPDECNWCLFKYPNKWYHPRTIPEFFALPETVEVEL